MASSEGDSERRFIIGIGVSDYDDPELNLKAVPGDVQSITEWFAGGSRLAHDRALPELTQSPTHGEISTKLGKWLKTRRPDDVVIIYLAAHGEVEGSIAYVQGRDSPRSGMAGLAITGETLGAIIGQAPPHNILVIVDACVAGKLGSAIQRKAEDVADELNTRDPHRRYAQAVLCSTFARDPAYDGRFAQAFLDVVSQERWTGTNRRWIDFDSLMDGLNHQLKALGPQVAERKLWGPGGADLIPNPNFAGRRLGTLIADEELATHFDPSSRGVAAGEAGWYFTGRRKELAHIVKWLGKSDSRGKPYVVTGSPGSGKSALVSRLVALSDGERRQRLPDLASLPPETVPAIDSINAVVWCHNKTTDQIIADLGNRLGLNARTSDEFFIALAAEPRQLSVVVDALDEAVEGEAPRIAANLILPLATKPGVKVIVATRRHPVRTREEGYAGNDLLAELGVSPKDANCLELDKAKDRGNDMRAYIAARLMASAEPDRRTPYSDDQTLAERLAARIATAAGTSFLAAAVTARSLALQNEAVDPDAKKLDLPTDAGAALAGYIERLPDPRVAVDILRPLAWAEGAGLPWGPLWAPVAVALAGAVSPGQPAPVYNDDTVSTVLDWASDLIVESVADGQPVYRLFHEALAEHLRRDLTPDAAHAAIASAIEETRSQASYESADAYVLAHLPAHLARAAGKYERLYALVTDPEWERAKRLRFGDSMQFLKDVDLVISGALQQGSETFLAGACLVYGRMMAVAPAVIVGVIARAGQLQRAELMANNIEFAVDRCLAYALIAPSFAADGDIAAAQRCLAEAERAISAIDTTHSAMAWFWVTRAAVAGAFRDAAMRASANALKAFEPLRGQEVWEFDNAVFWAAMAARIAEDKDSQKALIEIFNEDTRVPGRNQNLQAAAVLGMKDALRKVWIETMQDGGFPMTLVRDGNLALALADAGMTAELDEFLEAVAKKGGPSGEDDAQKRFAWALAISGDFVSALQHLLTIADLEHRVGALHRVVSLALERGREDVLAEAKKIAKKLARTPDWRVQALLAPVLFMLKDGQEAMRLAEDLVRQDIVPSQDNTAAFPRPDSEPSSIADSPQARFLAITRSARKSGRTPLRTAIRSLSDVTVLDAVAELMKDGKRDQAVTLLAEIRVPRMRWEGLWYIAESTPDATDAFPCWRDALLEARLVSEPAVRETVSAYASRLPETADGQGLRDRLRQEVRRINVQWIEAGFAEHYETVRTSLRSGPERTRLLEDLMVLKTRKTARRRIPAIDVAWWDRPQVNALIESGRAGKRAFALALMETAPQLAQFDVVLKIIRGSLSAFEQYHALKVMLQLVRESVTTIRQRQRFLRALAAERERQIKPGTDREILARQIERAMARIDAGDAP
jgi:hypothetical protein